MYSLGVLVWELLVGQVPWRGQHMVAIAYGVAALRWRLPLEARPGSPMPPGRCPPRLQRLLEGCWEADPRRRPAAEEMAKELAALREAAEVGRGGGPLKGRGRRGTRMCWECCSVKVKVVGVRRWRDGAGV